MLRKFKGISPDVDPKAHVFESADVIGMIPPLHCDPNASGLSRVAQLSVTNCFVSCLTFCTQWFLAPSGNGSLRAGGLIP